jgi:hypothetical protein
MKHKPFFVAAIVLALVVGSTAVLANPGIQGGAPALISFQGYLTDSGGQPLDGTVALIFGLYAASSGESPLWEETQSGVSVNDGYFSVLLGSVIPLGASDFSDSTRYLQVSVDSGGGYEDLPRQQVAAAPYALQAQEATNADTVDGKQAGDFWQLTGNAGTAPGTHFLGTTDGQALELHVNSTRALRLEPHATSPNLIGGYSGNSVTAGVYGATIGGGGASGNSNQVGGVYSTVSGGRANSASNNQATVSGGAFNQASGGDAVIGGGRFNTASGYYFSTVSGGLYNTASGDSATVGGGRYNYATAAYATIAGGGSDTAGHGNWVTDEYGTVGGGRDNQAGDNAGTTADATYATVGGGYNNTASSPYAIVGGGWANTASGSSATVGGGRNNIASGDYATVGGGHLNTASGTSFSTVSGGFLNTVSGDSSTVGGGSTNTAGGYGATVPGGMGADASHYGEMAYASGWFGSAGDAQTSLYVLRNETGDATPTELFLDGSAERLTVANGRVMTFDILVVAAHRYSGSSAGYQITGVIRNNGGATSFVGTPIKTVLGENVSGWDVVAIADDANDALVIQVTGSSATSIRWVATVRTVEVGR